jgi:3-deoxy-D-manno-octulosonic-acid transferase
VPLPEALYESVLTVARPGIRAASLLNDRLRRGVRGRAETGGRFREWAAAERSSERALERPLVWIHAPSVGEGLMAQAIIAELTSRRPDLQVAFTHFSPSAERMVADVGADVWGYVPWDTRGPVREALDALRPAAVVFVRTEVWPVLAREAADRGAALLLVNAVLSEGSGRLSRLARGLVEPMYGRLDAVGAVSRPHAERYRRLGVPAERIHVTGDARFDQVWARIEARGLFQLRGEADAAERVPEALRPLWRALYEPDAFTIVAGSTWAPDEKALLPPLTVLRRDRRLRLIIAPHEPTPAHIEALERRLDRLSLRHARLGALLAAETPAAGLTAAPAASTPEIVIVDRMGVLADLYALAGAAYVGGGFGRAGLHSVVEPAALGVPVLFGPSHGNAREAAELAAQGGGFVVRSAGDVEERLRELADHPEAGHEVGARAREFVRSETGSAARNAELVLEWVDRGSS